MRPSWARVVAASLALSCLVPLSSSPEETVSYFQTGAIYEYRTKLLELALSKTAGNEGKTRLLPVEGNLTQSRGLAMVREGSIDVASVPTSREREASLRPVRIDILRGLLGYRVFLIRADRQKDFTAVRTIDDLRSGFKAGFGEQWADMAILRENGLPVVGVADTTTLPDMLAKGRFDYYPRGINEAWVELGESGSRFPELAVERGLALLYPCPVYFFVSKDNGRLAERIGRGLELALADGSFKALFMHYHRDLIAKAGLPGRIIIRLANSTLPEGTPAVDPSWWLPGQRQ